MTGKKSYYRQIVCSFLGILILCVTPGCAWEHSRDVTNSHHGELVRFISQETFAAPPGSVYPEASHVPKEILAYATREYDTHGQVRRLLAVYFLRYDSLLIQRGLITAGASPDTLIGVLWDKEAHGWRETPSMEKMRCHLSDSTDRFCLEASDIELLEKNKEEFAKRVEKWKSRM